MIAAAVIIVAALALGGYLLSRRAAPVASTSASSPIPVATPATAPVAAPATVPVANATAISNKSIAVLPFENLSDEKQNAFFTDGVQDEILTHLAKIADLKVISRTSVMQYRTGAQRNLREIAQQLGVAHLVEGSVQRAGNKVRVNAQLIDARNDVHLWAQTYDRDLADVFAIQSEIAKGDCRSVTGQTLAESKRRRSSSGRPPISSPSIFTLARKRCDSARCLLIRWQTRTCCKRLSYSTRPWPVIQPFSWRGVSWPLPMTGFISLDSIIRPRAWLQPRAAVEKAKSLAPRCRRDPSGCGATPLSGISRL